MCARATNNMLCSATLLFQHGKLNETPHQFIMACKTTVRVRHFARTSLFSEDDVTAECAMIFLRYHFLLVWYDLSTRSCLSLCQVHGSRSAFILNDLLLVRFCVCSQLEPANPRVNIWHSHRDWANKALVDPCLVERYNAVYTGLSDLFSSV